MPVISPRSPRKGAGKTEYSLEYDPAAWEQLTDKNKISYICFCDHLMNFVSWITRSKRKTPDYHIFWTRIFSKEKGAHLCLSIERHRKGYKTAPGEKSLPRPLLIDATKLYAEYLTSPGIRNNIRTARSIRRECMEYFERCDRVLKEEHPKRSIFSKPVALYGCWRFAASL